jgi:glycosyltransferase involved in cell wall biosynthesis
MRERFAWGMNPVAATRVDVVVPVHDEEAVLRPSVETLLGYLERSFPFPARVVIADNASADRTPEIARSLAAEHDRVEALLLPRKGRGLALRTAWLASDADVVSYMDVDLSTNLTSFLPLVAPLAAGHSQVAIGTRLARSAHVRRQPRREVLSRGYNLLVGGLFRAAFSDAQCGFKALRADAARLLVPLVRDDGWFFDTELLLLAQRHGFRIHEVPVDWVEDLDSRVDLLPTIRDDLRGLWRVRRAFWHGEGRAPAPVPTGRLWSDRHTIGTEETMRRAGSGGIVALEGGGRGPAL